MNQTQTLLSQRLSQYGIDREAVHDQRASRAAGGDRGDQSEERHAAAGAHRAERVAEEHSSRRRATRSRRRVRRRRFSPRRKRRRRRTTCCRGASRRTSCSTRWRRSGTARCRRSRAARCRCCRSASRRVDTCSDESLTLVALTFCLSVHDVQAECTIGEFDVLQSPAEPERFATLRRLGRDLRWRCDVCVGRPSSRSPRALTLALGIGGATAAFTVVNAVLFRALPYHDAERLTDLSTRSPSAAPRRASMSPMQRISSIAATSASSPISGSIVRPR